MVRSKSVRPSKLKGRQHESQSEIGRGVRDPGSPRCVQRSCRSPKLLQASQGQVLQGSEAEVLPSQANLLCTSCRPSTVLPNGCRELLPGQADLLRCCRSEVLRSQSELLLSPERLRSELWCSGCRCSGRQRSPGSSERRSPGSEGLVNNARRSVSRLTTKRET